MTHRNANTRTSDGELYANGGEMYYRIVSGAQLLASRITPWEHNREVDTERVGRMVAEQQKLIAAGRAPTLFLPVPITFGLHGGRRLLMDGQHRIGALRGLEDSCGFDPATVSVCVCEVQCDEPEQLEDLFVRINSGTPVPAAYYNRKVQQVLDAFGEMLVAKYPHAVTDSQRPQRPNFNIKAVTDSMSSLVRDVVIDGRTTAAALLEAVERENALAALLPPAALHEVSATMRARAAKSGFYLGLLHGWPEAVAARVAAECADTAQV